MSIRDMPLSSLLARTRWDDDEPRRIEAEIELDRREKAWNAGLACAPERARIRLQRDVLVFD